MVESKSIQGLGSCYGCGVCSVSCPKDLISIELNRNGFYEPRITDTSKCVNCGVCVDVCGYAHKDLSLSRENTIVRSWAAWSNDDEVHHKCSSGGIGFEIGKQLIKQGIHAVGCRYSTGNQRAEHYIATSVDDFCDSIGSKYIQSYTVDAFKQIKRKGQKYIVTGTPCQIDSFRRMIQKFHCEDNFILMDFYCHSVPSMWAWKAYTEMLESQIGRVVYASWRNKPTGWHDSYVMCLKGEKGEIESWKSKGDLFYKFFLGDVCLGPQCISQCKYKYNQSAADIRIGDLWGDTFKDNQQGVNALISFTEIGHNVIESLRNVTLKEYPFDVVTEGQMKKNARASLRRPLVLWLLRHRIRLSESQWRWILKSRLVYYLMAIHGKLTNR